MYLTTSSGIASVARVITVLTVAIVTATPASAQTVAPRCGTGVHEAEALGFVAFPQDQIFCPLLADPKEPRSFISLLRGTFRSLDDPTGEGTTIASVGLGDSFGLLRWGGPAPSEGVQIDVIGSIFAQFDVGIIVLTEPVPTSVVSSYGRLPTAGLVDTLSTGTAVDLVGYGVQEQNRGGGPPSWTGQRIRMYAPTEVVSGNFTHSDQFLKVRANRGGGSGGTCFGDSGGPILLGNTVLAVNSYVTNSNCAGVTYASRVDLAPVLTWIRSFL